MDWTTLTATAVGSVVGVAGMGVYTHLFGTRRVTEDACKERHTADQGACDKRHAAEDAQCTICKRDTDQKMCSFNHEISSIKSLLMLIAIEMKIPADKLQQLVRQ